MRAFTADSFDQIYQELLAVLLSGLSDSILSSKGSNLEVRNVLLELTDISNYKINFLNTALPSRQDTYERYLNAELKWYFEGRDNELHYKNSPAPKAWKNFADNRGKIVSNYGYMIFREKRLFGQGNGKKKRKIDSYNFCIDMLSSKSTSKQAILHYNLPKHYSKKQKDVPCTVAGQVLIRNERLYMTVFQRSSDIYTGLSYDVPWHCELMKKFVTDLRRVKGNESLELGSLTIFITSLHLYQKDFSDAIKIGQNKRLAAA